MNKSSVWDIFPYPTIHREDARRDGSLIKWPQQCIKCPVRTCESDEPKGGDIQTCKYGINYAVISETIRVAGVVVTDLDFPSQAAKKARRQLPRNGIKRTQLLDAIAAAFGLENSVFDQFEEQRDTVLREMLDSGAAVDTVLHNIREDLDRSLNQSHDFVQLVKQIRGHIVSIFQQRFPDDEKPEDSADKLPAEGAIFYATELMQGKIDATAFLNEPNRVFGFENVFELHRYVTKYYRIYRSQATQKDVNLILMGSCHGRVKYNPEAIGAVIHSLLDNLVKYAPSGSKAELIFKENSDTIDLRFDSLGPKIEEDELKKIFLLGYRSIAAKELQCSGLGFGLGAARIVSDMLDLALSVHQDKSAHINFKNYYGTSFSLTFNKTG